LGKAFETPGRNSLVLSFRFGLDRKPEEVVFILSIFGRMNRPIAFKS